MPPKARYTREAMINAAFELVCEKGIEALSARALGAVLDCSPSPIFTEFQSMEELREEVFQAAKAVFIAYISEAFSYTPVFKAIGLRWFHFALEKPKLYSLLFMTERAEPLELATIVENFEETLDITLNEVEREFGLTREEAKRLYTQMILYAHGISSLCVTGAGQLTEEEVSVLYSEVCFGLIQYMKTKRGKYDTQAVECTGDPKRLPNRRQNDSSCGQIKSKTD